MVVDHVVGAPCFSDGSSEEGTINALVLLIGIRREGTFEFCSVMVLVVVVLVVLDDVVVVVVLLFSESSSSEEESDSSETSPSSPLLPNVDESANNPMAFILHFTPSFIPEPPISCSDPISSLLFARISRNV